MARIPKPSIFSDVRVLLAIATITVLFFLTFYSIFGSKNILNSNSSVDRNDHTFYDDPSLSYTITKPTSMKNWDEKRALWFKCHPSFSRKSNRILMVSGSQPGPCSSPTGDHLLLRFMKNKVDYCRIHGIDFFYNTALLEPRMFGFWAKIPAVRAAMIAHPEAEWIYWVDSDAAFTDMEFELPMQSYRNYNLILHGWPKQLYEAKSWTSLNAGIFLIRNCQWSMDFIDRWSSMSPTSKEYEKWGRIQTDIFKNKELADSDDQTGIAYMLLMENEKWGDKVYLENKFYFEGFWMDLVGKMDKIEEIYLNIEKKYKILQRRRAEKDAVVHGKITEEALRNEGIEGGPDGWRRPFITHFTGCQPCNGKHNKEYSADICYKSMQQVLNFADNQVLRAYGFRHEKLINSSMVQPLPFDFPVTSIYQ